MFEKIQCEVDGLSNWYKIENDGAFVDIIKGWIESDKETYLRHIKKYDVVVQAGGYCGIFPRLFSQIFDIVYTFEPDPMNFFCLVNNCQSENVIKFQAALGQKHEMISVVRQHQNNRGMNKVTTTPYSKIPTFCIDDLRLSACDFIQLDTEGYEYNILLGGINTIESFRPTISVEDTNENIKVFLDQYDYKEVDKTHRDTIYAVG